jgi:hypothetical protein
LPDRISPDRISIVIPTRKRALLLGQALRSARGQTWQDRETIVIGEASDNDSPAMLSRDFPEVRVIPMAIFVRESSFGILAIDLAHRGLAEPTRRPAVVDRIDDA